MNDPVHTKVVHPAAQRLTLPEERVEPLRGVGRGGAGAHQHLVRVGCLEKYFIIDKNMASGFESE